MKKLLAVLLFCTLLIGCNDGDIIVKNFNFDNSDLKTCGEIGDYVFYKENVQSFESLSLKLGVMDSLYNVAETKTYVLNGTNSFVNYRKYDDRLGNNYFCSSIPPTSPRITEEYRANSGAAVFIVDFDYDREIPGETTIRKNVQIILKDLVLIKGDDQIIVETLNMGTIENVETVVIPNLPDTLPGE